MPLMWTAPHIPRPVQRLHLVAKRICKVRNGGEDAPRVLWVSLWLWPLIGDAEGCLHWTLFALDSAFFYEKEHWFWSGFWSSAQVCYPPHPPNHSHSNLCSIPAQLGIDSLPVVPSDVLRVKIRMSNDLSKVMEARLRFLFTIVPIPFSQQKRWLIGIWVVIVWGKGAR